MSSMKDMSKTFQKRNTNWLLQATPSKDLIRVPDPRFKLFVTLLESIR